MLTNGNIFQRSSKDTFSTLENTVLTIAKSYASNILNQNEKIFKHYDFQKLTVVKSRSNFNLNKEMEILLNEIKFKLDYFANILYSVKLFDKEFKLILSLLNMFEYILDDKFLLKNNMDFLVNLIEVYFDLFEFKLEYKNNICNDSYLKCQYENLINNFRNLEEFFYVNIYSESESYNEEFLDKMSNILVR